MAPASLTSELQAFNVTTECTDVGNLNFARESDFNFRIMKDNELRRVAMSYYRLSWQKGGLLRLLRSAF
jgi:hypothetical protein